MKPILRTTSSNFTTKEDAAVYWEKYKKLVYKCAGDFARGNASRREELISLGSQVFMKALTNWQPEKAAFSTFLHRCLYNAFIDQTYMMKNREATMTGEQQELAINGVADRRTPDKLAASKELFTNLSAEAAEVVHIIFSAPDEVLETFGRDPHRARKRVMAFLANLGWGRRRASAAFTELTMAFG